MHRTICDGAMVPRSRFGLGSRTSLPSLKYITTRSVSEGRQRAGAPWGQTLFDRAHWGMQANSTQVGSRDHGECPRSAAPRLLNESPADSGRPADFYEDGSVIGVSAPDLVARRGTRPHLASSADALGTDTFRQVSWGMQAFSLWAVSRGDGECPPVALQRSYWPPPALASGLLCLYC